MLRLQEELEVLGSLSGQRKERDLQELRPPVSFSVESALWNEDLTMRASFNSFRIIL